jgi:hypothetical protein
MEYQHYHDMNLIPFQQFPYDNHHQFQRQDSLQLLSTTTTTTTTDQVFSRSDINSEESIRPERGIAGFVSKLYE